MTRNDVRRTSSEGDLVSLRRFAFRIQAPRNAVSVCLFNGTMGYLALRGVAEVPVFKLPFEGGEFHHSLLGTLTGPAVFLAFLTALVSTRVTVRKRVNGAVSPPLEAGTPWLRFSLRWGSLRALVNLSVVYSLGFIVHLAAPEASVPHGVALTIVAAFGLCFGYVEAAAAVLRTRALGNAGS